MTLRALLENFYTAAVADRLWVLLAAVLIPVIGTLAARFAKGGTSQSDGRRIASIVVGIGIVAVLIEVMAAVLARLMGHSVFDADVLLLLAPVVCLAGCLAGIRWAFPLSELASVRTFLDVSVFLAACIAVLWLASRFYWGVLFFGGLLQFAAIATFGYLLLRRLYRRALGRTSPHSRAAGAP